MDLESASHVLTLTMIIIIKFEVDMTIHCRVIAFLLKIRYMTLWPWSLTFWPWTVVIHGLSCDQPCHRVRRSYANYNHYNYRNWVITSSTDTNENVFVCGHCSCAHLPIQYTTFIMLWSHARTVVRECCKGDDESQWERVKFDPPPPKNPLTDGHQNLHT